MKDRSKPLTTHQFWENLWASEEARALPFAPRNGPFGCIHTLLQRTLPYDPRLSLLEIGCYPGRFMWYFQRCYGYRVEGVEYIDWCCERTRKLLQNAAVTATVRHLDFLAWEPEEHEIWDVVASFGFVEHFKNYAEVIAKHALLVRPGGWLVIEVPNHTGFYGRIMKLLDPPAWRAHNHMGLEQLVSAVERVDGMTIIAAQPCGRFSLEHVSLLERSRETGRLIHLAAHGVKLALELLMRPVPATRLLSPYLVVVARKQRL